MLLHLLLLLGAAHAVELGQDEDGITVVTAATFDQAVASHPNLFVEFFAPWCGVCASFAPEYAIAEKKRKQAGIRGTLAKIDATTADAAELKKRFGIAGFPTLYHFVDGVPVEWTQKPLTVATSSDILGYLSRFQGAGGPYEELASADDLASFSAKNDDAFIGCFHQDKHDSALAVFKRGCRDAIMRKQKVACAFTTAVEVCSGLNVEAPSAVSVRGKRTATKVLGSAVDFPAVRRFLVPPGRIASGSDIHADFNLFGKQLVALVPAGHESIGQITDLCAGVHASPLLGDLIGTTILSNPAQRFLSTFGLVPADLSTPHFVVVDLFSSKNESSVTKRFRSPPWTSLPDDQAVSAWLADVVAGKAKPFLRSAPVVDDAGSAVKTVVASSFSERVLDSTAGSFILFTLPQAKPRWLDYEMAAASKQLNSLVGMFDLRTNEIPMPKRWMSDNFPGNDLLESMPAAFFWPAGSAEPTRYLGEMDADSIAVFVAAELKK
jgi:thiol-disulfide isomerase/thioredoxin